MNYDKQAKQLFTRAKADKRRSAYKYREGTVEVSFTPRKLISEAEMALAAMLLKHTTQSEASRIMQCSKQTLARAARAWYHKHHERQERQ